MKSHPEHFELVAWTFPFYGTHQDFELDRPGIEAVLKVHGASAIDKAEASSRKRRLLRLLYRFADSLPFDVPPIGNENLELHLTDLRRYVRNKDDVADKTRAMLQAPLTKAANEGRPVLLIGHSMGSVIAYDTLWQLSHESKESVALDMLLTLGSPLGQKLIRRKLLGHDRQGAGRYPNNISTWTNIAAVGDLTAIEMNVKEHYSAMLDLGLTSRIDDQKTYTYFREHGSNGELSVHSEYGYLINEATARVVADWWLSGRALN